jgi:ketosteroid isomerase-like protein
MGGYKLEEIAHIKDPIEYNMRLVDMHLHEENPEQIDECLRLYTDDVVWEAPTRGVAYHGKEAIKKNYLALFEAAEGISFEPLERFATLDRVVDDMWVRFKIIDTSGFENCPYPVGTKVKMRLVHIFHIRDGLISREMGYEGWSIDND